jgi:excisionase family DNA binding protein
MTPRQSTVRPQPATSPPPVPPPDRFGDLAAWIPAARLAELLGVSVRTVRRWRSEGRIRGVRTANAGSGRLLLDRDSVMAALGME